VRVQVQLFAEDSTVRDLVQRLGLPPDLERVTLVNGGDAPPDRALQQGDVVAAAGPRPGPGYSAGAVREMP
jgi:sulfur carrier protein ThiS